MEVLNEAVVLLETQESMLANGNMADAITINKNAARAVQRAVALTSSDRDHPSFVSPHTPLALKSLDTPDTRGLLALLKICLMTAENIDRARGRIADPTLPNLPGVRNGTDWAETISDLVTRLELEVIGPKGRD